RSLSIDSIELMSNNPDKIRELTARGIRVNGRIPIEARPNPHNQRYLETKRLKAGHLLSPANLPEIDEQMDCLRRTANPTRPVRVRD
ncbi:GTP cyclohydrolase II, partial [mine drainage metagenome]